jgi:hypothetical protein
MSSMGPRGKGVSSKSVKSHNPYIPSVRFVWKGLGRLFTQIYLTQSSLGVQF